LAQRANVATMMMPFVGRFFSNQWMRQNIFGQSEQDIEEMDMEMMEERENPLYMVQTDMEGNPLPLEPGLSAPPMDPPISKKK
jgi:hypothetical protein